MSRGFKHWTKLCGWNDIQWDATGILSSFYCENFYVQVVLTVQWIFTSPYPSIIRIFLHLPYYSFSILLILLIKYFKAYRRLHVISPSCASVCLSSLLDNHIVFTVPKTINNNSLISSNTELKFVFYNFLKVLLLLFCLNPNPNKVHTLCQMLYLKIILIKMGPFSWPSIFLHVTGLLILNTCSTELFTIWVCFLYSCGII